MNRTVGIYSSAVNLLGVLGFAVCMLAGPLAGSYLSSIFIAFGFVGMTAAFAAGAPESRKAAGYTALGFGVMYALCNSVVYYTQLTAVLPGKVPGPAADLLDFQRFGLIFNLDMLGYCLMAVATVFAGLSFAPRNGAGRWLRGLLLAHGVFAASCFVMPMLGVFTPDMPGGEWIGTLALEAWCLYFAPIAVLSILHFREPAQG